jgi:hypothetical protein
MDIARQRRNRQAEVADFHDAVTIDETVRRLDVAMQNAGGSRGVEAADQIGMGGRAWFTPALANLYGGPALEVVVASHTSLEVHNIQNGGMMSAVDSTASFYPSAVIEPRTGGSTSPAAQIYVSGWVNGKVYRYNTPNSSSVPANTWSTFMGNNQRTGFTN